MNRVIAVLAIVTLVCGWNAFVYKQSGGRMWSPLWIAFSATAASVLYLVAGAIGYTLSKHDRSVTHTSWTGHVIWSEIGIGLLAGFVATYFWRRALQGSRAAGQIHA